MNKLISVVTPYYNQPWLVQAVQSVLAQSYPRIEYIIIDDCSRQSAQDILGEELCRDAAERLESFTIVRHDENLGTVRTMNQAWSMAKGEYVFTLAADDIFWNEDTLALWTEDFTRSGAEVSVGYRAVCDEDLSRIIHLSPQPSQARLLRSGDRRRIWERLCRGNFLFGSSTARTGESIRKYGPVSEDYRLIEDWPQMLSLYRQCADVRIYHRVVVKYRLGGTSSPERVNDIYRRDTVRIFENEIYPYCKDKDAAARMLLRQTKARDRQRDYLAMRKSRGGIIWNIYCRLCYPECFVNLGKAMWERLFQPKHEEPILEASGNPMNTESEQ